MLKVSVQCTFFYYWHWENNVFEPYLLYRTFGKFKLILCPEELRKSYLRKLNLFSLWLKKNIKNIYEQQKTHTHTTIQGVKTDTIAFTNNPTCSGIIPPNFWQIIPPGNIMMQYPRKKAPSTISWVGFDQLYVCNISLGFSIQV